MKSKTFRLEDSDIELLRQLAVVRNESQTDALRYAIQNAASALHGEAPKSAQNEPGEVVSELIRQLKVKDAQIEALNTALVGAQETAKAAQVLQARTMGELPETTGEAAGEQQKKSWWQRLFG